MYEIQNGVVYKRETIETEKQKVISSSYYAHQFQERVELIDNEIVLSVQEFYLEVEDYKATKAISYEIKLLNKVVNVDLVDGKGIVLLEGIDDIVLNGFSFYRSNAIWRQGDRLELAESMALKREELNGACRAAIEDGMIFQNDYDGKEYHVTTRESPDQLNMVSAFTMLSLNPSGVQYWFSSEGVKFYMDMTALVKFGEQFAAHKESCLTRCGSLKDQLAKCATVDEVEAISWTNGE